MMMIRIGSILLVTFVFLIFPQTKIAIFGYGSLINRPSHSITGAHLQASEFMPTPIMFPINLSLLANKNRITAVIDIKNGNPKRVWFAISNFRDVRRAVQNLAAREGAAQLQNNLYDSQHISYLRRKTNATTKIHELETCTNNANWAIYDSKNDQQRLPDSIIRTMIRWAEKNKIDIVLWVSCPIVTMSKAEFIARLLENPLILKNAQQYISLFPDGPQTDLEHAILSGRQSLKQLMQVSKNSIK
jgi:hypothetical protein